MKRNLINLTILFILITSASLAALIEDNDYADVGLVEKNGTYGMDTYLRTSSLILFTGVGTKTINNVNYSEFGARLKVMIAMPEMLGFFFKGDVYLSRNSLSLYSSGDLAWTGSIVPYFGETHFGYQNKYLSIKLGFQNLISSDAIYNHILIDDYSGSIFTLRVSAMMGRFLDADLVYSILRPHQGPWYSGDTTIDLPSTIQDKTIYDAYYGKSIYIHKINIRPLPWIRLGVYEGVLFLGENFNPWYAIPIFPYIATQAVLDNIKQKEGSKVNSQAANLLAGIDFNIGFKGWRVYGEFFLDDFNGEYLRFMAPSHPDKFGMVIGGELRGYLFTNYMRFSRDIEFFLSNLYCNVEYGIVSKYTYARESAFNHEYVRDEYKNHYDPNNPPTQAEIDKENRIGNFLGFMYGPNSDCLDIAIGWRSDLWNVKEYTAGYQGDTYFNSFKSKKIPDRLVKLQLHFRRYRLGDERNVIMPFYWNEHPSYDLTTGKEKSPDQIGTSRGTEFLVNVVEIGNILDLNIYSDIFRISRFVLGAESKFVWDWQYYTATATTNFYFRWEFGIIMSW